MCTAAGVQTLPAAVSDGAGGMIVTWLDARPGAPGIYAQRLLADGTIAPGWPADGVLCSGASSTGPPGPVPDGAGGVLIVWQAASLIYAQRIDANGGIHAGWPVEGKLIIPSDFTMDHGFGFASDGAGDAYFTRIRYELPANEQTLRLTRITSEGLFAPGWSEAGRVLAQDYGVSIFCLAPDPAGGVVCGLGSYFNALVDFRFGRIVRIRPDATVAFNKDCTAYYSGNAAPGGITQVAAAPDGAGGAYGTWHDFDSATPTHGDFGQHFNSSGTALWTAPYAVPFSGRVVQDGSVGVWWVGRPPGVPGIEVHRRLASGALPTGWTSAGVTITESTSLHSYSTAALPTALALCWSENGTGGDKDLRALSVNQEGVIPPGWESGGTPVCTAVGDQIGPFLLPDGAEGALACWVDQRAGASACDIYATRIEPPPLVGVRPTAAHGFGFVAAGPNPARDRIELTFELSGDEPATLEVLDLAGRSLRRVALAGGTGPRTASLGLGDLGNGVYFLRITQGTRAATTRVAIAR